MAKKIKENVSINFMIISDYAFTGENGKVGIVGIFDLLGVPNFPAQHPEMFLVANIKGKENSEHEVELILENPNGENLLTPNPPKLKVRLSGTGSGNLIQRFLNLTFKQAGFHKFVLLIDGKKTGETQLSVIKINKNGKTADTEAN